MASDIRIEASTDGSVTKGDVYAALREIDPTDLSKKSPVTNQIREAYVAVGDAGIAVKVEGHDGEWSRSSQNALTHTLAGIGGVDSQSVEVASGGYESDTPQYDQEGDGAPIPEDDDDEDEKSPDVSAIDGVGPSRAEQLRDAGIETVDDVIDGGADALVEAGISEGVADNIVESA